MTTYARYTLETSDGQRIAVDAKIAKMCTMVSAMADTMDIDAPIPLPIVDAATLSKVVEFCTHHVPEATPGPTTGRVPWAGDAPPKNSKAAHAFLESMDQGMLFQVLIAANYMGIGSIVDAVCEYVAGLIKGKSVEEIRRTFNIAHDFSPEDDRRLMEENQWAFEHAS